PTPLPYTTLFRSEEAVGGDAELGAGNQGPARPPTGGEDDVRGLQAAPGGRGRVLIEEARPGAYQLDLVASQVRGVRLVQLEDVGVAPLLEQGPVVPGDLQPETVVRGVVQRAAQIGRVPVDLLRHAADVHAGAAQAAGFHQHHPRAVFGGALRCGQPAAAAADHHQVEFLAHTPSSAWPTPCYMRMRGCGSIPQRRARPGPLQWRRRSRRETAWKTHSS